MQMDADNNSDDVESSNGMSSITAAADDDEKCKCGDTSKHEFECALYCGQFPCADKLIKLPKCDHRLHDNCLQQLLFTRMSSCPLCRSSINLWRTTKHYDQIEKEIEKQFDLDTAEAIRLSQEVYQQPSSNNSQRADRNNESGNRPPASENRNRRSRNSNADNQPRRHSERLRSRSRSRSRGRDRRNNRRSST